MKAAAVVASQNGKSWGDARLAGLAIDRSTMPGGPHADYD
jgi:hypothetical protein